MMVLVIFSLATGSVTIMFALLFVNGWFQGMGWPPCERVVVHWFSVKERGAKMSIWNVGGGLMAPLAIAGLALFGTWGQEIILSGRHSTCCCSYHLPVGKGYPTILWTSTC
jgi:OPA family glycerol-3-phosphate transporter-like MFS transporter